LKFWPPGTSIWRRLLLLAIATFLVGSEISTVNPYQVVIDMDSAVALLRIGPTPTRRTEWDTAFDPPFARSVEQIRRRTPDNATILMFGPWPAGQGDTHYYAYAAYVLSPRGVSFCDGPCRPPVDSLRGGGPLLAAAIRSPLPSGWTILWKNQYAALGQSR
jgi:hypothetical protein